MAFPQQFLTVIDQPEGATLELVAQDGNHQSVPLVPVTSVLPALSAFWWVDAASTATTPDGSEARPYPNINEAVAAAAAALLTRLTLMVVPGSYPSTTIDSQASGLQTVCIATPGWANGNRNVQSVLVADLTWTPVNAGGSELNLQGIAIGTDVTISDGAGGGQLVLQDSAVGGQVNGPASGVVMLSSFCSGAMTASFLDCRLRSIVGNTTVTTGLQAWDSSLTLVSVAGDTYLVDCQIGQDVGGIAMPGGAQVNTWQGCQFPGGGVQITMAAAGLLFLDGISNYWFAASSSGLVAGQILVTERPQQATIAVAVPALLAAVLGYVDVSTAGTPLAGLTVGDLVGFNPLADVEAAGAGNGGPLYARVSAADTIRLAFLGTTTAHNVDFLFYKLS